MNTIPKLSLQHPAKSISWAEVVLHIGKDTKIDDSRIKKWCELFHRVTVISPKTTDIDVDYDVNLVTQNPGQFKADLWNQQVEQAEAEWVLFVQDEESITFLDFPCVEDINERKWPSALISWSENDIESQLYQMRFVPASARKVFSGRELPDCTRYITENEIQITSSVVQIERSDSPVKEIDSSVELGIADYAPQVYLMEGQRYFREKEYVYATSQFRQLLKKERLLPFDRLGAVNGIASCLAEQYKWDKALNLTYKSIEAESFQNLPYLIQYRIYQLQQKWEKAYRSLSKYYDRINLQSAANFDVILSEEEALINLSELALKSNLREQASEHLNKLFAIKNGKVDNTFLKKMLLLCIELGDLKKVKFYFGKRFDSLISEKCLDDQLKAELNDFTTLFMENEWYEFVHDIYEKLHLMYPEDEEFKRRLIVTSVKTDRVEKARTLATRVA